MKRRTISGKQFGPSPQRVAKTGRMASDPCLTLNGILGIVRTNAPWQNLPERFALWQTVYDHFARWRKAGVCERNLESHQVGLDVVGEIHWHRWCIDRSSVRVTRAAAWAAKKAADGTRTIRKTTP